MSDLRKALAVALLLPVTIAGCSAAGSISTPASPPIRLTIAEAGPDFVIRRIGGLPASSSLAPAAQLQLGSTVHLDRRLVTGPAQIPSQETSNGPID